jgi:hypothetical protein
MKVIEPGHIYELSQLDGDGKPLVLKFVRRDKEPFHEGTQIQEVVRVQIDMLDALIDRVNHCDDCLRWEGNDTIIKHFSESQRRLRLVLLKFEERALERKVDKQGFKPEAVPMGADGHFKGVAPEKPEATLSRLTGISESEATANIDAAKKSFSPGMLGVNELGDRAERHAERPLIAALKAAQHELTTLNGLVAADGASPKQTWSIDTTKTLAKIEAALK